LVEGIDEGLEELEVRPDAVEEQQRRPVVMIRLDRYAEALPVDVDHADPRGCRPMP
jgi:hypothetical protein